MSHCFLKSFTYIMRMHPTTLVMETSRGHIWDQLSTRISLPEVYFLSRQKKISTKIIKNKFRIMILAVLNFEKFYVSCVFIRL